MKRMLVTTLVAALALMLAVPAFAAANPFADVPPDHWAYGAIAKLAAAGIIDGAAGRFNGEKPATRYELAQLVAKAMVYEEKADANLKKDIEALKKEFAAELKSLGVRVAALEAKQGGGVTVNGESRIMFQNTDKETSADSSAFGFRQRIWIKGHIAENIDGAIRFVAEDGDITEKAADESLVKLDRMYVTMRDFFGIPTVTFGRMGNATGKGLLFSGTPYVDGLSMSFGGIVKATVTTGQYDLGADMADIFTADLKYKFSDTMDVTAAYLANKGVADGQNTWSVGTTLKLGDKLSLVGEYAQNDASADPKAFFVELTSGKADAAYGLTVSQLVDAKQKGASAWAVIYHDAEAGSLVDNAGGFTANTKGYTVAYQSAVARNVLFTVDYKDLRVKDAAVAPNEDIKIGTAKFEFWF